MDIRDLLKTAVEKNASDLHITVDSAPIVRVDGKLIPLNFPKLDKEYCKRLVYSILDDKQKAVFERDLELDLSLDVPGLNRFRVNVHMQRGSVEAAFRLVPSTVRPLKRDAS